MNISIDSFESFLKNKALKPRTIQNYIYYFNKFTFPIFNQDTVSQFMALKQNRNTVSRGFLLNLKKFLLLNYRALGFTPDLKLQISEVELPKLTGRQKQRIPKPIPHDQIFLIEKSLNEECQKLQLMISYFCGLRLGELCKIRINNFNWQIWGANRTEMGECRVYGKGDKEGIALVPAVLMERIAKFIHTQQFLGIDSFLFGDPRSKNISLGSLGRIWQKRLAEASLRAGVSQLGTDGKLLVDTAVHPHRLRHSYASYLLNEMGMDIQEIRELLRHSSISTTQLYAHVNKDRLKKKLANLGK